MRWTLNLQVIILRSLWHQEQLQLSRSNFHPFGQKTRSYRSSGCTLVKYQSMYKYMCLLRELCKIRCYFSAENPSLSATCGSYRAMYNLRTGPDRTHGLIRSINYGLDHACKYILYADRMHTAQDDGTILYVNK